MMDKAERLQAIVDQVEIVGAEIAGARNIPPEIKVRMASVKLGLLQVQDRMQRHEAKIRAMVSTPRCERGCPVD